MSRISGKVNLLNLHGVVKKMKGQTGEIECIVIPIEKNKLFKSEKGVYLDLITFEIENPKEGTKDTHIVKQSFSKDVREKMSEEELKALPILGNLMVWGERTESSPISSPIPQDETDDLPF